MLNKLLNKIKEYKKELAIIVVLLLISGIAHGYNMFHFPYYENDEGAYMSQAWSLLTQGRLAPYTYWYDHAPAGWMFIALWVKLTGGFFTFGTSVDSGRVLMLLLHLETAYLLFYVAKKLSKGYLAGIIAVLIFSLSPLGIYFQRRVLLDNIMVFWVFLSLALLLKDKLKLSHIIISAICFSIAVLTKENAIFFIPAFLYIVYRKSHEHHRSFAIVNWLSVSGIIISFYFLYALLKGEFFPVGFLGNNLQHVSLLTTLQEQFGRGGSHPFWDSKSDFYVNLMEWVERDLLTIILGAIATIVSIVLSIKEKSLRIPVFLAVLFWLFLMRGKLVIDFYVVPLIPLLALNIGMLLNFLARLLSFNKKFIYHSLGIMVAIVISTYLLVHTIGQYTRDETTPQLEALAWVFRNVPNSAVIAIDEFAEVEFREMEYPNAAWFWKMWYDPEIQKRFSNDWKNINYLYLSHEMLRQIGFRIEGEDFLRNVYLNSERVAMFGPNDKGTFVDFNNYKTTNGDWVAIYKLPSKDSLILSSSWRFYKSNFIKSYGQVVDPHDNDKTTSEGQSYTLLRAVYQDELFSWLWLKDGKEYKIGDAASASDADEDIALSLLFAYKQWGDETYFQEAKEIMDDIWRKEVVVINGRYYLVSGTGAGREDGYLINPSYLSPTTYRVFAEVDTSRPWEKLANDSYYLLNRLGSQRSVYLPPNWILID